MNQFNLPKSVTQLNSIFDTKDLDYLIEDTNRVLLHKEETNTNFFWDDSVKEFSVPIQIKELKPSTKPYEIINRQVFELVKKKPESINYYFWGPGSYIPWHNDAKYSSALTIYLNEKWNIIDGGLFQYIFNNNIYTVIPRLNTGVLQSGGVFHSTTIQSKNSPVRKSIQIWFSENKTIL